MLKTILTKSLLVALAVAVVCVAALIAPGLAGFAGMAIGLVIAVS